MKRLRLRILTILLVGSMIAHAEGSTPPGKPGIALAETPPAKLYTEAEALAAADAAVKAALDKAIPLAVQAAVAQKEGELAGLTLRLDLVEAARQEEASGARKARAWLTGLGIGAAVLIPAAFIGGAIAWGALPR